MLFLPKFVVYMPPGSPPEGAAIHAQPRPFVLARPDVFLHQLGGDANHMLTLPILHHVHAL